MQETITETVAKHFLGKIVTILTVSTGLPLQDGMAHATYFSGELIRVDQHGVYLKHVQFETLSFYAFPLVGIIEEKKIAKDDPGHVKIQEEIARNKEQKELAAIPKKTIQPGQFVDINELKQSLNKVKTG